jgi:hypothetical protein
LTAIFTLAGVIVGAVLGGLIQMVLQRRGERREHLVAKRLLEDELLVQTAVLGMVEDDSDEARDAEQELREHMRNVGELDEVWTQYRAVLASELDRAAWVEVRRAVRFVWLTEHARELPDRDELIEQLKELRRVVDLLKV